MILSLFQVDAFTEKLFAGNPAAVCPLDQWLPDTTMQAIAAENNLSETAFFVRNDDGSYHLRWFTPAIEVDLCGHATLATAHILFKHLHYDEDAIYFHTRSGLLTVTATNLGYTMDFPTDQLSPLEAPEELIDGLGLTPLATFQGREDYLVLLEDELSVALLEPNFRKLAAAGGRGVLATAPGEEADFVSRCFFPNAGINEDPVTGSAHTSLTPFWAERLGKNTLHARQISRRGGEIRCHLAGDRVLLTGHAVTYLEGKIQI